MPGKAELLAHYLSASTPWLPFTETDFASYIAVWPAIAVNTVMQVGHNTLRLMAVGMENRAPSDSELFHRQEMLADALDAGALGMSSGLFTPPGFYAEPDEIRALGRVLKQLADPYARARIRQKLPKSASRILAGSNRGRISASPTHRPRKRVR